MRDVVVPAIDEDVRALLRRMGEPITFFGEKQVCGFLMQLTSCLFCTTGCGDILPLQTFADGEAGASEETTCYSDG